MSKPTTKIDKTLELIEILKDARTITKKSNERETILNSYLNYKTFTKTNNDDIDTNDLLYCPDNILDDYKQDILNKIEKDLYESYLFILKTFKTKQLSLHSHPLEARFYFEHNNEILYEIFEDSEGEFRIIDNTERLDHEVSFINIFAARGFITALFTEYKNNTNNCNLFL